MFVITPHTHGDDSRTMMSYDHETGMVVTTTTDPTTALHPEQTRITLAQFLREIGIPFPAVRELTRPVVG